MNKLRKALVVILSALFLLCVSLFAACTTGSGKTQAQKPDDAVTPGQSEQESEEKPGDPQEETCDIHVEVNDEALGAYRLSGERAVNGGFKVGTPVTVTVEPAAGYDATLKVNGEEVPLDGGSYTFTAQADTTLSVDYNYKYRISTTVLAGEGTITPAAPADGEKYAEGEDVKVEVAPAAGYVVEYVKINGVVTEPDEDGKYTVKMTGRMYVVAEFIAVHTITVENNGNGTVTLNDAAYEAPIENVKDGTVYTLKVTPADGEEIKAVYVNGALTPLDAEGKATITVKADTLIKVVYVGRYTVSLPENENVVVNIAEGKAASYAEGTVLHITVSAVEGYRLTSVTVKVGETPVEALGGVYTVTMSANVTVEADVEALAEVEKHTVTILYNNGSLGSAELTGAEAVEGQYAYGSELTLTVTPNEGNKLDKVEVNGKKVALEEGKYSFTVKEDTTIYIVFKTLPRYIVTVDDQTGADATIAVSEPFDQNENHAYYDGEELTITATEIAPHCLVFVAVDGGEPVDITADENGNYVWKHTVTADVKLTVTVLHSFSVEINNDPLKGTVERLLDDGSTEAVESWYQENEEVTLIITPLEGYRISKVTVVSGGESFVDEFDYITASHTVALLDENAVVTVEYVAIYDISVNVAGIDGVENASVVLTVVNTGSGEQVKELGTLTESGEKTYTLDEGTSLKAKYTAPVTHRVGLDPQIPGVSFGGMGYVEPGADEEGTFDFSFTYNGGSVSVTYELYTHTVTVDGQLQEAPVTNSESYKLPAQPDPQYGLNGLNKNYEYTFAWVVNGVEYAAEATVENVRKDLVVTSKWSAQLPVEKNVTGTPEGGSVDWGDLQDASTLIEGTEFDVTIVVPQGYRAIVKFYTHIKNAITGSEDKVTTAMGVYQAKTEDLTAHFKDTVRAGLKLEIEITYEKIFTVTVTENENVDVVILSHGDYNNDYFTVGNVFEFTVTAHEGYRVTAVKANGEPLELVDGKYSYEVEATTTITIETVATAKLNLITSEMPEGVQEWTLTTADGTSLTEVTTLDIGSKINVIVNLKPGYYFYGTEISGTNMNVYPGVKAYGNISLNNVIVKGDVTINIVVVARDHFTVTETHDEGATVTLSAPTTQVPDMSGKYYYNEKVTVTVNVDDQHVLASVKVNERVVSLNGDGTYTLTVTDNVTITVSVLPKLTVDFPESKPGEPSTSNGAPEQGEWKAMDGADNVIEIGANTMTINGEAVTKIESNNKTGGEVVYTLTTKDGDYTMEWFGQAEGYILMLTDPSAAVSVSRRAVRTIAGGVSYYVNPKYSTEYFDDFVEGDSEKLVDIEWTAENQPALTVTNADGKIHISLGEDAATYVFAVEAGHYLFVIGAGAYDLTLAEDGSTLTVNETTYSNPPVVMPELTAFHNANIVNSILYLRFEQTGYENDEAIKNDLTLVIGSKSIAAQAIEAPAANSKIYIIRFQLSQEDLESLAMESGSSLEVKLHSAVADKDYVKPATSVDGSQNSVTLNNGEDVYTFKLEGEQLLLAYEHIEAVEKTMSFAGTAFVKDGEGIYIAINISSYTGHTADEVKSAKLTIGGLEFTPRDNATDKVLYFDIAGKTPTVDTLALQKYAVSLVVGTDTTYACPTVLDNKIGDVITLGGKNYTLTAETSDGTKTMYLTIAAAQTEYTVTIEEGYQNGTVELTEGKKDKYSTGDKVTLHVKANEGYKISSVKLNAQDITARFAESETYEITVETENIVIHVEFVSADTPEPEATIDDVYNPFLDPAILSVWVRGQNLTEEYLKGFQLLTNGTVFKNAPNRVEYDSGASAFKLYFEGMDALAGSDDGTRYEIEFNLNEKKWSPTAPNMGSGHDLAGKHFSISAEDGKLVITVKNNTVDPDAPKNLPYNDEGNAGDGWTIFNQGKTINEATEKNGVVTVTFSGNESGEWWGIQVFYKNKEYTSGAKITVSFTITSTVAGKIRFFDNGEDGTQELEFKQGELTLNFKSDAFVVNSKNTVVKLYMAIENEARIDAATITISDLHIKKVTDPEPVENKINSFEQVYLEKEGEHVWYVVTANVTGYTQDDLQGAELFDGERIFSADHASDLQNGKYGIYFDIAGLTGTRFYPHFRIDGKTWDGVNGDIKCGFDGTKNKVELESERTTFTLATEWDMPCVDVVVIPAENYLATEADIVANTDENKVYFVLKGTYEGFEKGAFETLLNSLEVNLQHVPAAAGSTSGANNYWNVTGFPTTVTVNDDGTWEIKIEVTVGLSVSTQKDPAEEGTFGKGAYVVHVPTSKAANGDIDLPADKATDEKVVTLGSYNYQLINKNGATAEKDYWGHIGLVVYDAGTSIGVATINYESFTITKDETNVYISFSGTCKNITTEEQLGLNFWQDGTTVNPDHVEVTLDGDSFTIKATVTNVASGDYIMHLLVNGQENDVMDSSKKELHTYGTEELNGKRYTLSAKEYSTWGMQGRICLTVEELNAPELTLQKAELLKDEDSKIYIVYTVGDLKNCEPAQLANVKFNGADGGLTWVISQTKTYKVVGDGTYKIYFEITNVPEGNREYYGNWWRTVLCFDGQSNLPKATGCVLGETKSVDGENGVYYTLHDEGGNPYFIVNQKLTITLNFGEGYEPESEQATVDYEANYTMPDKYVTLTRTGYIFGGWLRDGQKVDPNEQGKIVIEKVTDNLELTASWTKEQYDVTVSDNLGDVEGAGSVTVVPGNGQKVEFEGTVTITVSVNEGYRVTVKVNDHAELENYTDAAEKVITVTATGAVKIEVIFESTDTEASNSVSPKFVGAGSDVSESDAQGAISGLEGFRSYKANESVTISFVVAKAYGATATADAGVELGDPEIVAEGDDYKYTYTFTMPDSAVTVTITVAKRVDSSETKWGVQSGDSNISYQWQWFDKTRDDSADSKDKDENGGLLYGTITINMYDVTNMADAATHNFTLDTPYATVEITSRGFFARSNIEDVIKATWTEKGGEGELKLVFAFVLHPTENKRALGYTDSELWYATEGGKDHVSDTREIITYDFASEPVITWDKAYLETSVEDGKVYLVYTISALENCDVNDLETIIYKTRNDEPDLTVAKVDETDGYKVYFDLSQMVSNNDWRTVNLTMNGKPLPAPSLTVDGGNQYLHYNGRVYRLAPNFIAVMDHPSVTFDKGEGVGGEDPVVTEFGNPDDPGNMDITLPDCTYTAPAGKAFIHWLVSVNSEEGTTHKPGEKVKVNYNDTVTVTAVWDHVYENGVCTICGVVCDHAGESETCSKCGATLQNTVITPPSDWSTVYDSNAEQTKATLSKGARISVFGTQTSQMTDNWDTIYAELRMSNDQGSGFTSRADNWGWKFGDACEFSQWVATNDGSPVGISDSILLHITNANGESVAYDWGMFKSIAKNCNWLIEAYWVVDDQINIRFCFTGKDTDVNGFTFEVIYALRFANGSSNSTYTFDIKCGGLCTGVTLTGVKVGTISTTSNTENYNSLPAWNTDIKPEILVKGGKITLEADITSYGNDVWNNIAARLYVPNADNSFVIRPDGLGYFNSTAWGWVIANESATSVTIKDVAYQCNYTTENSITETMKKSGKIKIEFTLSAEGELSITYTITADGESAYTCTTTITGLTSPSYALGFAQDGGGSTNITITTTYAQA